MDRYADADIEDDDDDGAPYDDPVARTRMAWLRTMLIVGVVGLLLVRSAYVDGQQWWSLGWLIPSVLMLGVGFARVSELARLGVGEAGRVGDEALAGVRRLAPLGWTVAGFLALAAAGAILATA
jgi:hypothetical protein